MYSRRGGVPDHCDQHVHRRAFAKVVDAVCRVVVWRCRRGLPVPNATEIKSTCIVATSAPDARSSRSSSSPRTGTMEITVTLRQSGAPYTRRLSIVTLSALNSRRNDKLRHTSPPWGAPDLPMATTLARLRSVSLTPPSGGLRLRLRRPRRHRWLRR